MTTFKICVRIKSFLFIFLSSTFLSNAQNVGIGTPTPQTKLHINSSGNEVLRLEASSPFLSLYSGGVYKGYVWKSPNSIEVGSAAGSNLPITFAPNGYQLMYIGIDGNVGIGTLNPAQPLTLGSSLGLGKKITLYPGGTGDAGLGVFGNELRIASDYSGADITFGYDTRPSTFTERMRIRGNGDVGIGTANPAAKLQVSAGDASLALFGPNSTYGAMLYVGASPANQSAALTAQVNVSDGNLHIDPAAGKNLYFGYFQPRDIFLNPNGGKVGIGTTPAYTLDVTSSSQRTVNIVNTTTLNNVGLVTSCNNTPNKGRGIEAYGGEAGVSGYAIVSGAGSRIGVIGYGWDGALSNYGVYGSASSGVTAYGIYGSASNAVNNWSGYFAGNVYAVGSYSFSDRKLKNDIRPLSDALSIINQLKPSIYTCKTSEYKQMHLPEGLQYGLIADEVQRVLPGAVKKAVQPAEYENHDDKKGKKLSDEVEFNAVNYTAIIPILIGGMKEQQVIIENQNKKIDQQQQQINQLLKEIQLIKEKLK